MSPGRKTVVAGVAFLMFWGALATYTALLPAAKPAQLAYDPVFFPALLIGLGIVFSLDHHRPGHRCGTAAPPPRRRRRKTHTTCAAFWRWSSWWASTSRPCRSSAFW